MLEKNIDNITCVFTGRMGNQMFQIAAVIGLAIKHGVKYSFKRSTDHDPWKVYFNNLPELLIESEKQYNEDIYEYKEIPYNGGTLCLCGYFQSEKYFSHCREEILKAFNFKWNKITNKVSIHVRRADYVVGTPFEPITMEYITKAILFFKEKGYYNYYVFSDDMEWCKRNVNSGVFSDCKFEYSEGKNEFEDLELISSCEHNVTANSTFSWWGAWLNRNLNKIVVTPEKWFNGVNKDLIPDSWIKL